MFTRLRLVALALCALAILAMMQTVSAAEPYGFLVKDLVKPTEALNVRSAAGTSSTLLGTAPAGTPGKILAGPTLKNNYYWWKVDFPSKGYVGWCVQDYLALLSPRAVENWKGTQVEVDDTGSAGLRIRSGAGLSYGVVTTLAEGTPAAVLDGPVQKDAYVWWKLYTLSTQEIGWGVQEYLSPYTPPPVTSGVIFNDSIAPGWVNWSWGAVLNTSSSTVYSGSYGLAVGYTTQWGGLHLHTSALQTGTFATLRFAIRGYGSDGQVPYVALTDTNGAMMTLVKITDYLSGNRLRANEWSTVAIPLTHLDAVNKTVTGVVFQLGEAGNMYLDAIELSASSGSTYNPPSPPPPIVSSRFVFDDSVGTGWYAWDSNVDRDGDSPLHFSGYEGMELAFGGIWAAFQFCPNESFDTTGHNALTFAIHMGESGGQDVFVRLYDANHERLPTIEVKNYIKGGVLSPYVWHEVRIPLVDLEGTNREITAVEFESGDSFTITVDDVRFDSFNDNNTGECNVP